MKKMSHVTDNPDLTTQDEEQKKSLLEEGKQLPTMGEKLGEMSNNYKPQYQIQIELAGIQAVLREEQARSAEYREQVRWAFFFACVNQLEFFGPFLDLT